MFLNNITSRGLTRAMTQAARLLEEVTTQMEAKTPSMSKLSPAATQKTFIFIVKQSRSFIEGPFSDDAAVASKAEMMSKENKILKNVNVIYARVGNPYSTN